MMKKTKQTNNNKKNSQHLFFDRLTAIFESNLVSELKVVTLVNNAKLLKISYDHIIFRTRSAQFLNNSRWIYPYLV